MKNNNPKNNINILNNANYIRSERTEKELAEEKANYNKFMNFMANIIVKYGLIKNFKQ